MPLEFAPPKYAQIVNALQQRISDGTYVPGSMIPSETALMAEFNASRPTVVRALGILQQDGWIDSRSGVGRFVRSRPPSLGPRGVPEHAVSLLSDDEMAGVKVLSAGPVLAPNRAASALEISPGTPVIARQRLVVAQEVGPVELSTVYVPVELAAGTRIGEPGALDEGALRHLSARKGVEFGHATERISARVVDSGEADVLQVSTGDVVLTMLVTAFDRAGRPQVAVDVLIPASRHELEDAFPLS